MDKAPIEPLRILLADDHALFREAMAEWLKHLNSHLIIDHAASLIETAQLLTKNFSYQLVMIDLHMPGMNGVSSVKNICKQAESVPVVIVSADESPVTVRACMETKIAGYILKSSDGETVLWAIRSILNGVRYLPESILLDGGKKWTEKQQRLLLCLAKGMSNKEISSQLHLSEGTVKQYVSLTLTELRVNNRTKAGLKAQKILGFSSDI